MALGGAAAHEAIQSISSHMYLQVRNQKDVTCGSSVEPKSSMPVRGSGDGLARVARHLLSSGNETFLE